MTSSNIYIGLMSGTSLDGIDGVAAELVYGQSPRMLAESSIEFDPALRQTLFALQSPGNNEIDREACAANKLAAHYALAVRKLLAQAALAPADVRAIGVHGQTIRHRPEKGYTRQVNNPALLAELTGIDVIADFRSRDIAAGGQGAPLVPAFHAVLFSVPHESRVICNIGGISNITILGTHGAISGFDCGPGNMLLDDWAKRQTGLSYDKDGQFAARGRVNDALLNALLADPYFSLNPPKSTGRDLFNPAWLNKKLDGFETLPPADIQATLTMCTAMGIAQAIAAYAPDCQKVYVCGGGAYNPTLLRDLSTALMRVKMRATTVTSTDVLGVPPHQVEALAFAWLAMRFLNGESGNLATVTGAKGTRILGALYPR